MLAPKIDFANFRAAKALSASLNATPSDPEPVTTWGTSTVHNYVYDPSIVQGGVCWMWIGNGVQFTAQETVPWTKQYLAALQAINIQGDSFELGVIDLAPLNKHELIEQLPLEFAGIKARLQELNALPDANLQEGSLRDFSTFLSSHTSLKPPYVFATETGNIKVLWEDEPAEESPSLDIEFIGNQKLLVGCVIVQAADEFDVSENTMEIGEFKPYVENLGLWTLVSKNG